MQTLKNMIEASLSKQEEIRGQRGPKNEDSCLQYINKTKNLLTFLIDEMDEEVFSCLQSEACTLSCQSYENEIEKLLTFINDAIIETYKNEFEKLLVYIETAVNNPSFDQFSRVQLKSNECESNSYSKVECDVIQTDYLKYNEILDPEEIKSEGLTFAYKGEKRTNDKVETGYLIDAGNVAAFLTDFTNSSQTWDVYCCVGK